MSQDNILAALKPFADAWDEYVRDGGPDDKASAEILFRPDSEFIAASDAMRDVEDIRSKQPMSPESRVSVLEDALANAKIALRILVNGCAKSVFWETKEVQIGLIRLTPAQRCQAMLAVIEANHE